MFVPFKSDDDRKAFIELADEEKSLSNYEGVEFVCGENAHGKGRMFVTSR